LQKRGKGNDKPIKLFLSSLKLTGVADPGMASSYHTEAWSDSQTQCSEKNRYATLKAEL